jgi:large subunit ribosomal protein L16
MFTPTPRRFRKVNRHTLRSTYEHKSNRLRFGAYGLQALEFGFLTGRQLEAVRRTLTARLKRKGKLWLRALPVLPRTSKPKEVRRGRGKGAVSDWVCPLKPGRILLEVAIPFS